MIVENEKNNSYGCRCVGYVLFGIMALGCSVAFLVFWIIKNNYGFISVPYSLSTCTDVYFLVKYSEK